MIIQLVKLIIPFSRGWDQQVRDRIRSTYFYFGSGIVVTAAAAAAIFRSPRLLALASQNSIVVSDTISSSPNKSFLKINRLVLLRLGHSLVLEL